jgi:transcriptional regulator with XRE-family HTH domain
MAIGVGPVIRRLRESVGMGRRELASAVGVETDEVKYWEESGVSPSPELLEPVALALGTTSAALSAEMTGELASFRPSEKATDGTKLWKIQTRDPTIDWNYCAGLKPEDTGGYDPEHVLEAQFDAIPGIHSLSFDFEKLIEIYGDGYYIFHQENKEPTYKKQPDGSMILLYDPPLYRILYRRMFRGQRDWEEFDWKKNPDVLGSILEEGRKRAEKREAAVTALTQGVLRRAFDPDDPDLVDPKDPDNTPS